MNFAIVDYFLITLYFLAVLLIGWKYSAKRTGGESKENFILAGRKVTLPFFVASLVATWYGNIMGMGEFVYNNGLAAFFCFGLPYYIAAFLFAVFISKRIRKSDTFTIPEQIAKHYGTKAGYLASGVVLLITVPAAYVLMLGTLISMLFGWDMWISMTVGSVISILLLYTGGLKADIIANTLQFVLMYLGFGVLFYFSLTELGSISDMNAKLPTSHLRADGGLSIQYILAWYVIAFQTFIDPSFHQRCAAAKNPRTAYRGIMISIVFWMIFDFLTLMAGLYAVAYFQISPSINAFPTIANSILPPVWKGLFFVAMLATIMSTLESYTFLSASTIGNDLFAKIFKIPQGRIHIATRWGLLISSISAIFLALLLPSAIDLIYKTSSIAVPALIVPLVLSYSRRYYISRRNVAILMISTAVLTLFWTVSNSYLIQFDFPLSVYTFEFEPMIPGIILAIIMGLSFVRKRTE